MKLLNVIVAVVCLSQGIEVWAAPQCPRGLNSLPDSSRPAGQNDGRNPIQHIIVIMQENHSFDNYFGALSDPKFYGSEVDGIRPDLFNLDSKGQPVHVFHETNLCISDPAHDWNDAHADWNFGKMDGFVKTNEYHNDGRRVMGYYTEQDIPYYYALAQTFAIGDRFFSSTLGQTYPNRFFMLTGSAFGNIRNLFPQNDMGFAQRTIFERLNEYGVTWSYYHNEQNPFCYLALFQPMYRANLDHMKDDAQFARDLAADQLPQVVFLDATFEGADEHPGANVQKGQAWAGEKINQLLASRAWRSSVLFLTYDENGGFFDHVPPPEACAPDSILPDLHPRDVPGNFERLGFRVPFVAISPYAKRHYVSHQVYDHTSILKFIATKYNLPPLTLRDANADGLMDLFDFDHPNFDVGPLPSPTQDPARDCH